MALCIAGTIVLVYIKGALLDSQKPRWVFAFFRSPFPHCWMGVGVRGLDVPDLINPFIYVGFTV